MPTRERTRAREDLPDTLKRSPAKARRTYLAVHDAAVEEYGEGERAHRTAFAALKHGFEKVGDHWEPKDVKGPSDPRDLQSGRAAREGRGKTYGGVDYFGHTKQELYERARRLEIEGRSRMSKDELADAISKREQSRSR